ncbi:uncharacterized protein Dwil_GK16884 [Drosophila willistoni]|uniref:Serine/arginine repetitive matrix protein 2 n=1 Tax=Drosophila willistoni TaxID=7260 RepID=B4MLR2_DROWI|nr:serine/arginine repetitive matrix protein 2 [Drosophila willistoni]EDW72988.1 uncharacterized protein Dwil_GK16884 [Drosophila willistoni]
MSTLAGVAVEELQDGDTSSLEPGEVVTPPRNTSSPAGAKKLLSKDLMSRTLRKLTAASTQIDGHENGDCEGAGASASAGGEATKAHDGETGKRESEVTAIDEAKVRSKLELEVIRRKEEKLSAPAENGIKDESNNDGNANDNDVAKAEQRTAPPNDDDEGLYSDTDSSGDEQQQQMLQQNVEDVQQARKEKQLEAAAAQAQAQVPPQPSPHPFLRCSPMRFHSRPVCFDFPRMGFMPRMVMLGHNRLRPPTFFNGNRSQTPQRMVSPMKSNSGSPALPPGASGNNGGGAGVAGAVGGPVYGPVLPPSIAKKPQSELVWTSCQPPVSYVFNLVNGCGNQQHKDCKHKDSASECKDDKQQKPAKSRDHKRDSKRERSKDRKSPRSSDRKRDLLKERQNERSKEKIKESSTKDDLQKVEKPKDKSREQQQPKDKSKDDKSRIDTKEKSSRAPSKDKGRDEPRDKSQRDVSKEKVKDKIKDSSSTTTITSKHHSKDKLKTDTKEPSRDLSKESHRESREQPKTKSKETHRERSPEPAKDSKSRDRSKDKPKERSRERKEHADEHRDKARERSKEDKHREREREETHKKRSRSREDRKDKLKRRSRSRSKTRQQAEIKARTPPPPPAATPTLNPTATPLVTLAAEMPQESPALETPATPTASFKPFDIFAESPPRLNAIRNESKTAESLPLLATATSSPANTTTNQMQMQPQTQAPPPQKPRIVDRSTTPPLNRLHTTPLLRASEIHSRIDALLNDNDDLHLEALLAATKEQLLKKEKKSTDGAIPPSVKFHVNPFKREVVLNNGQNEWDRDTEKKERDGTTSRSSRSRIKIEKCRSPSPVSATLPMPSNIKIKIERNMTPPPVPMPPVATVAPVVEESSPDTDDYIDNWENDDSLMMMPSVLNTKTEINQPPSGAINYLNGDLADDDSNTLWNAKSTPPPKAKQGAGGGVDEPATPNNLNINDIYDRFMNSIQEGNNTTTERDNGENADDDDEEDDNAEDSSSDSSSTSTSSSTNSSSESTSSSDSDDSSDDSEDEEMEDHVPAESTAATSILDEEKMLKQEIESDKLTSSNNSNMQKKNNVSKDLRKLKNLEDNLGRIQMMRENYDPGDDICEELLKMESLFQMQRNAIMDKYRKHEQASSAASTTATSSNPMIQDEQQQLPVIEPRPPSPPVNSIFDANREAIKLTISPLKLTRKSVIFDRDDTDQQQQQQQQHQQQKTNTPTRPPKEIAIVKPTILETRSKAMSTGSRGGSKNFSSTSNSSSSARRQQTPRDRTHSRSRSISRQRSNRRRGGTPSPKRWRPPSPINRRGSSRSRYSKIRQLPRSSRSRTLSRSRTRSRSPHRRARRSKHLSDEGRRRKPLSPLRHKNMGPRSPPPPSSLSSSSSLTRRRSYSRSRSPLPFKPPSPPMRRSWSRSPPGGVGGVGKRRLTRSRSRSHSRSRTPMSPQRQSFADYFEENPGLEAAAACYYYNMYHQDQDGSMATMGDNYGDAGAYAAAYMDASSYTNMEQAYAQYTEYNAQYDYGMGMGMGMEPNAAPTPGVLRELPKAPINPVAVQKGNVLEIVPSAGLDIPQSAPIAEITPKPSTEEPIEDKSKPKRKRVNFVDNVLPNYESESEDRSIVERAVERALHKYREKRSTMAAKLQRIKDELLALPPPPPPLTPKPPNVEKPVMVQKKPKFLYFHFDPHKGAIIKGHTRMVRPPPGVGHHHLMPRFDAKRFSMLMKSGNLPPLPPHLLRQRPPWLPPPHADAMTKASIFKEFFSKHPPPPLPHYQNMLRTLPGRPIETVDSVDTAAVAASSVASAAAAVPPPLGVSQPIPVLGGGHNSFILPMTVGPVPAPLPVLPIAMDIAPLASLSSSSSSLSSSASVLTLPFFTPPPLPQFTVQSVPSIREIMPVDILQKLGPLPKTLDLEEQPTTPIQGNAADELPTSSSSSSSLINTDLSKEKQLESNPTATADPSEQETPQQTQPVVEQPPAQPMLLVETQ